MENECNGFFGKLFGHRVTRYLIKIIPPDIGNLKMNRSTPAEVQGILHSLSEKWYIQRCSRCGRKYNG